jgi:phage shock protein PspC (stress-responsive transcriptional regulator)
MGDRLYRSRDDRMLAGVAGGLAEMWDADPSLVRIVWALLVIFTGGIALIVYIVMAIVVPEEDGTYVMPPPASDAATDVVTDVATSTAPTEGAMPLTDPALSAREARAQARAARRAARAERGAGTSAGMVVGGFLVLLGLFFLLRQFLPQFDFDWFWPLAVVGLGVVLIVTALGRGPRSGGTP